MMMMMIIIIETYNMQNIIIGKGGKRVLVPFHSEDQVAVSHQILYAKR